MKLRALLCAAAGLIPLGCDVPAPETAAPPSPTVVPLPQPSSPGSSPAPEQVTVATQALASVMGGIEAGIDAPWRLEPIGADIDARSNIYPPIPLVISVHDASLQRDPETRVALGQFCGVSITEAWNDGQVHYDPFDHSPYPALWNLTTSIPASSPRIREIERSDKWPYNSGMAANHRLCRRWAGENCNSVLDVGSSAEWHATVEYHPQQYAVGGTWPRGSAPTATSTASCSRSAPASPGPAAPATTTLGDQRPAVDPARRRAARASTRAGCTATCTTTRRARTTRASRPTPTARPCRRCGPWGSTSCSPPTTPATPAR